MKKTGRECFVAIDEGTPKRKMWIYSNPLVPEGAPVNEVSGWCIVIDQMDDSGDWQPLWDTWEETFERTLLYPSKYVANSVVWKDEKSGEPVDIYALELEE